MEMSLLECESGHVHLAHHVGYVVPYAQINEAGHGVFIVIVVQQDVLWLLHLEVCDGVFEGKSLAGIAWQPEDNGAVGSACRIRHLRAL